MEVVWNPNFLPSPSFQALLRPRPRSIEHFGTRGERERRETGPAEKVYNSIITNLGFHSRRTTSKFLRAARISCLLPSGEKFEIYAGTKVYLQPVYSPSIIEISLCSKDISCSKLDMKKTDSNANSNFVDFSFNTFANFYGTLR